MKTRVGIVGWGNLGRGVARALAACPDLEGAFVLTRRDPAAVAPAGESLPFYSVEEEKNLRGEADILILCGSSAHDLPRQTPQFAQNWCVVDSFDTHKKIPAHFSAVDAAARRGHTLAVISAGWDPGLLSLWRLLAFAAIPDGACNTFWGRGVSQGHSDAVRHIPGVVGCVQYTIPKDEALFAARRGDAGTLSESERIRRVCYVAAAPGADRDAIAREIAAMPHYFAPYETAIFFVSEDELQSQHASLAHAGSVFSSGGEGEQIACSLRTASNPHLTAQLLLAAARAAVRLSRAGETGCRTFFEIPPALLLPDDEATLRKKLL